MTLVVRIPGRPMSSNDRDHWRERARKTARTRDEARLVALLQLGPRPPQLHWPVTVTVQHNTATARRSDTANCQPAVKAAIDGLTDAGLWPDDGPDFVAAVTFLPPVKTGTDELVLHITDSAPAT